MIIIRGECLFLSTTTIIHEKKCFYCQYNINIISALKDTGYSTYRLRKEKLLGESTLQKFRNNELVSWENISIVCKLLNCQPSDILEYMPDNID